MRNTIVPRGTMCARNMGIFAHDCFWGDAIVPRGTIVRGHGAHAHRAVRGEKNCAFFGAGAALGEPRF